MNPDAFRSPRRLPRWLLLVVAVGLAGCTAVPEIAVPEASGTAQASASASASPVRAPAAPRSLLWVGNSFFFYNNSMHSHVGRLLAAAGAKGRRGVSATISGAGLHWHDVAAYFKPGGVASHSFVGDNELRFNAFDKPFDAVLMMDCSQCPLHPRLQPLFHETVSRHSATVRAHRAEPILFMSWAYRDRPEMTQALADEYIRAGQAQRALVVPAGLAFAESMRLRPEVALHAEDKRHPSLAGTYLAACTVLASVYRRSPVGNAYTAGLPADVAAHLQRVAWDTAQAFHARHGRGSL